MDYLILLVFTFTVYIILLLYFGDSIAVKGTIATCMLILVNNAKCDDIKDGFVENELIQKNANTGTEKTQIKNGFVGNGNSWTFKDIDDMLGYGKKEKTPNLARMPDPIPSIIGEEHVVNYGDGGGYQTKVLKNDVLRHNAEMLNRVLNPKEYSADDKIFEQSRISALKPKKSLNIRSHWNNNNWKKYFDYELNIHQNENRDWWTDDDFELSKKHIVI